MRGINTAIWLGSQAVWQYFDGKTNKKFGKRGSAALEAAYQEKKPFAEWTDKHGRKHKASLKNWKMDYNGKSFSIRRFEPGNQFFVYKAQCVIKYIANGWVILFMRYHYGEVWDVWHASRELPGCILRRHIEPHLFAWLFYFFGGITHSVQPVTTHPQVPESRSA